MPNKTITGQGGIKTPASLEETPRTSALVNPSHPSVRRNTTAADASGLATLTQSKPQTGELPPVPDTDSNEWLEGMCRGMDDAEWFLNSIINPNAQNDPSSVSREGRLGRLRQAQISVDFANQCLQRYDQSFPNRRGPDEFILRGEAYTRPEIEAHLHHLNETIRLMRATNE